MDERMKNKRSMHILASLIVVFVVSSSSWSCARKAPSLRATVTRATDAQGRELMEFAVTGDKPVPVRALDPVLFVSGRKLQNYHYEADGKTLRFVEHDPRALASTDSIQFEWDGDHAKRASSKDGWHAQKIAVDFPSAQK